MMISFIQAVRKLLRDRAYERQRQRYRDLVAGHRRASNDPMQLIGDAEYQPAKVGGWIGRDRNNKVFHLATDGYITTLTE